MSIRQGVILKNIIWGAVFAGLGFYLSIYEKRPIAAIPDSAVDKGEYFVTRVPFQWGSVAVAGGCFLLLIGVAFLLSAIANFMEEGKMHFLFFVDVEKNFHKGLVAFLIFFLFMVCEQGFTGLTRIYYSVLWRELPVEETLAAIRGIVIVLAIVMAVYTIVCLLRFANVGKLYNVSAIVLSVVGLLAIFVSAATNLWYFAECLVWIALYKGIMLILRKREEKLEQEAMKDLMDSGILDEIDF